MKKNIARWVGYPLQDFTRGTSILSTLDFLKSSQYWDNNRMHDYQLTKLKKLIDYASVNVPYYESLFKKLDLSSNDIKTLDDLKLIPILTKKILREEGKSLISKEFDKFKVKKGKTGGTTGVPVLFYKDAANRTFTWASYYRWYEWMGLNYFDPISSLWGAKTVVSTSFIRSFSDSVISFLQNNQVINSFALKPEDLYGVVKSIVKYKPVLLKGYLSSLLTLAEYMNQNNLHIQGLNAISTTTETLLPHNREFLQKVFHAPIYDQYGCGEVSAIAFECSKHNGLHINQEHVICEVLNPKNKSITDEPGRVIATDLDNYVMPFIRYENEDVAILSKEKCLCGVNQPLLKSIEGRTADTIQLNNGAKVHGVFFTDIFFEIGFMANRIQRFQIKQESIGRITIKLENKLMLSVDEKELLQKVFKKYFNEVNIVEVQRIENEPNGKFKYIKSLI